MDERQRHQRAGELFLEALQIPADGRGAWVTQAAAGDELLLEAVRELLAHDDEATGFLEQPLSEELGQAVRGLRDAGLGARAPTPPAGGIDGYELLDVVGDGGTSVVYRAVQAGTTREVALKLLKAGLATPQVLRRLANEAEVLGLLDHPALARVFAAGCAEGPTGPLPYIVMELVHGQPITEYVARESLSARATVTLVLSICEAVEHAHTRGVIHRDIKPANILVDEGGQPKLLDFGVARVLEGAGGPAQTMLTAPGQLVGTAAWMSPEQARADGTAVDVRSDVYALGLLLFRLLAGRMPYDSEGASTGELLQLVKEASPRRLGGVDPRLRGDLDTIVDRCLRKRPEDRYGSVDQLRADLQRWLRGEPIAARPPTTLELLRRVVRTHRVASAAVAVGLVALLVLLVQQSLARAEVTEALRLATEAQHAAETALNQKGERAEQERLLAWAIAAFLNDSVSRTASTSGDETVLELLNRAQFYRNQAFSDDPGVRGAFLATMYRTYSGAVLSDRLGDKAVRNMLDAVELLGEAYGAEDDRTLAAQVALACRQREPLSDEQLHALRSQVPAVFPPEHAVAREARVVLARHEPGPVAAATIVELLENTFVQDSPDAHLAQDIWGGLCTLVPVERRLAVAEQTFALPFMKPSFVAAFMRELLEGLVNEPEGAVSTASWDAFLALAEQLYDRACLNAGSGGGRHVQRVAREHAVRARRARGDHGQALRDLEQLITEELSRPGPAWLPLLIDCQRMAEMQRSLGRPDEALRLLDFVLALPDELFERGRGLGNRKGLTFMLRASQLEQLGRVEEAEADLLEATRQLDWNTVDGAWYALGEFYLRMGRDDMIPLMQRARQLPQDWRPGAEGDGPALAGG